MLERINTEIQLFYDTIDKKYYAKAWIKYHKNGKWYDKEIKLKEF